jgi:2TM domain-containing protein
MDGERERYERARARMQALKGFYIHASAFVVVNIALLAINSAVGGVWWFYWPLIGWGIGLGVHALAVFGFGGGGGPWGREWEERKVQEIVDNERGHEDAQSNASEAECGSGP